MKTDDLIAVLALEPGPTNPARLNSRIGLWSGSGALVAAVVAVVAMGARPDLTQWTGLTSFLGKAAYTLSLAVAGFWLLDRLGRPGASPWRAVSALLLLLIGGGVAVGLELAQSPADAWTALVMGRSAMTCPLAILALGALTLPPALVAARRLAPLRPSAAGAAAGLLAGGLSATAYGLHCAETAVSFLVIWYGLGVLATTVLGAVAGARVLRW